MSKASEVGQKLRNAIKAKLIELSCYVNEQLPDYVMVMIANKRTAPEMRNELKLFLEHKTDSFVNWLHHILKKLKKVSVSNSDFVSDSLSNIKKRMNFDSINKKKPPSKLQQTNAVNSTDDDFDIPTLTEVNKIHSSDSERLSEVSMETQEKVVGPRKPENDSGSKMTKHARITFKQNSSESKTYSSGKMKRCLKSEIVDVVRQNAALIEKPKFKSKIGTRTNISHRNSSNSNHCSNSCEKRKQQPVIYANRNLLLKAIEEARKSIEENDPKKDFENLLAVNKPKELFTKSYREKQLKLASTCDTNEDPVVSLMQNSLQISEERLILSFSDTEVTDEVTSTTNSLPQKQENNLKITKATSLVSKNCENPYKFSIENKSQNGLLLKTIKPKSKEKCKYWPNCRNQINCEFIHPSVKCQLFPVCKFGDRCIYIHPECKFGQFCAKVNCSFWHTNRKFMSTNLPIKSISNFCKFASNCVNPNCIFVHPGDYV